jgi:hypothetical protein
MQGALEGAALFSKIIAPGKERKPTVLFFFLAAEPNTDRV